MTSYQRTVSLLPRLWCLLMLNAATLWAQTPQYQGPESSAIPAGVRLNTENFANAATVGEPIIPANRVEKRYKQTEDEFNRTPPAAPLGSNEFYDKSTAEEAELSIPRTVSGFQGIPDIGASIPPDPHMAAGPEHLILTVNARFGVYDKTGNLLKMIDAGDWYGRVLPNASPCDPQVVYDHHTNRFIMVWIECGSQPYSLYVSISDDSDPLGEWCNWRLPGGQNGPNVTGYLNDYPKLGVNDKAVYVTVNMYQILSNGNSLYQGVQLRIIPKAQLLDAACGAVTWTDFWDLREPANTNARIFTAVPAVTFGNPDAEYFISDAPYTTGTFVTLWELYDPAGTPFLVSTNIPTTAISNPSGADQLGGGTPRIDVGGRRFRNAVYKDGSLWSAQSVAGGTNRSFAFARYVRLDVNTFQAAEDVAFGADNFWYYYPAVQPDGNGNLFLTFTRSGLTEYASARHTGRLKSDPPGLQASFLLKGGEANYVKTFGAERNRWGDYVGIALDPADSSKVWMLGQYAASEVGSGANADRWGTWVGETSFTPLSGKHLRFEPDSIQYATLEIGQESLPVPITIANIGTENVTIASVSVSAPSFVLSGVPALPKTLASFKDLTFAAAYQPVEAGPVRDVIRIRDNNNQTLFEIPLAGRSLGAATLQGTVRDSLTNVPIKARLQFLRAGETTPRATATTDVDGSYSVSVLEGDYAIDLLPEIPYSPERRTLTHPYGGSIFNFALTPASVVLVNDDSVAANLEIYKTQLAQLGYKYALWNLRDEGTTVPANRLPLLAEPRIMLWFTGETKAEVLSPADRNVIIGHLRQGNPVLLSGDNIAETSSADDSLLSKYFGVEFDANFSPVIIRGFAGDPIGNGLLTGAQGASKDILKLTTATQSQRNKVFRYVATASDTVTTRLAAVRVEDATQGWRAVFFGFRLEAATATSRRTIFERTLNWLKDQSVAVTERFSAILPADFYLSQNHPNPFNPATTITFHLPQAAFARLSIYDLSGRVIATLVNERKEAGEYRVKFVAHELAAGVYFYRLQAGENVATRKLVLLR